MGFFTSKLADAIGGAGARPMSINPAVVANGDSVFSGDGEEGNGFQGGPAAGD